MVIYRKYGETVTVFTGSPNTISSRLSKFESVDYHKIVCVVISAMVLNLKSSVANLQ